jgi:hypothetical protein
VKLVYVIGLAGVGKSTAVQQALLSIGYTNGTAHEQPLPHIVWQTANGKPITELGRRRETFSGTDALALNIQPKATAWLESKPVDLVIAEGDRLANAKFFDVATNVCDEFIVALIEAPVEIAMARAHRRAQALGVKPQNEVWWKGRATKVANLTERYAGRLSRIDGTEPRSAVASALAKIISA